MKKMAVVIALVFAVTLLYAQNGKSGDNYAANHFQENEIVRVYICAAQKYFDRAGVWCNFVKKEPFYKCRMRSNREWPSYPNSSFGFFIRCVKDFDR